MATLNCLLLVAVIGSTVVSVEPAKIIMFSSFGSQSHLNVFYQLGQGLAAAGHEVTIASMHRPRGVKGIREIFIEEIHDFFYKDPEKMAMVVGRMNPSQQDSSSPIGQMIAFFAQFADSCRLFLENEEIKQIIADGQQYDVAINNAFGNDCSMPVAHRIARHFVQLSASTVAGFNLHGLNVPHPYATCPCALIPHVGTMSFRERFVNSAANLFFWFMFERLLFPTIDAVVQEKHPGFATISSARKNTALLLTNRVAALDGSIPLLPIVQEIGGINVQKAKPLPKDLEDFVQGSGSAGIVYVAFGSVVPEEEMPEEAKLAFIEAFSKIPQRVIWKFKEKRNDLPPNVKTVSWAPQQDILGHPKCRAFVSHGGYNSLLETVFHGVPIVGMPVFAEQPLNLARAVSHGYGLELPWTDLSADALVNRLDEIVNNTRYKEAAVKLSKIVSDQPEDPLAKAVYWVEYVIRHDGTRHLRSSADGLNWLQYFLLDVMAVVVVTSLVAFYVTYKLICLICCRIGNKRRKSTKKD